jgi:DNA-binding protein HU-beta
LSKKEETVSQEKGGNGMTKADLVAKMASEAGITKAAAERALKCVTNSIQGCLRRRERISLPGLGSFSTSNRRARTGRNPRTGQTINIPAKTVPKFSAAKELTEAAR